MTRKERLYLIKREWWRKMRPEEASYRQLHQRHLCMPFDLFHMGVERLLRRQVHLDELDTPRLLIEEAESPPFKGLVEMVRRAVAAYV